MRGILFQDQLVFCRGVGPPSCVKIGIGGFVYIVDGLQENECQDEGVHMAELSTVLRYVPVNEAGLLATCSGVPLATTYPPAFPPSGPRSIIQSPDLITSRLCSIISTVPPASIKRLNATSSLLISSKCNPVVGSSKMNIV